MTEYVCLFVCPGVHAEVKGQLGECRSLLPPRGFQESDSGCQACGKYLSPVSNVAGPQGNTGAGGRVPMLLARRGQFLRQPSTSSLSSAAVWSPAQDSARCTISPSPSAGQTPAPGALSVKITFRYQVFVLLYLGFPEDNQRNRVWDFSLAETCLSEVWDTTV